MKMKCKECDFYHEENNTCQSKKCYTGGDGTVTWFDKLFCTPYKQMSNWMERIEQEEREEEERLYELAIEHQTEQMKEGKHE